jgi:hypothetical protein
MITQNTLELYYQKYKQSNSNVTFFHWLEGDVQSIGEVAKELNFTSIDELRMACKKLEKKK